MMKSQKTKLLSAAFLEGFLLVTFELISAQLLHPIFGNSYFVWIIILAVTMTASAAGYYLGSWVSKRQDPFIKNYTAISLILIGVYVLIWYTLNEYMLSKIGWEDFILSCISQTMVILFIPLVLITSFSPILIKYYTEKNAGTSSSKIFFTSTIGGIIAVYSIAFIILPNIEFLFFLKLLSFIVIGVGIITDISLGSQKWLIARVILSLFLFIGFTKNQATKKKGINTEVIYRDHGIMGEIEVREELGTRRYLSLNRTTQSAILKENGASLWSYPYRVATYASLAPEGSNVLVAGLGGGILINHLLELNFNIDCIEFDKRMIGVAKKYMGMRAGVNVDVDDFRHYINYSDKKYDLIVLDLSKGESIPTNVYTVEAFRRMSELLKPDGYIILHYFSDVYGNGEVGLYSILKTMKKSGFFAGLVKKNENDQNPEQIIVASNNPEIIANKNFRYSTTVASQYGFVLHDFIEQKFDLDQYDILWDNNNRLEKLQYGVVKKIRQNLINNEQNTFYKKPSSK